MAQTVTDETHLQLHAELLRELYGKPIRSFAGRHLRIPIRLTPEARARRDWNDAVKWLEAREAARQEWPWPER